MNNYLQNGGIIFDWGLFRRDVRRDVRSGALLLIFFYVVYILAVLAIEFVYMIKSEAFQSVLSNMGDGNTPSAIGYQAYLDEAQNGGLVGLMSIVGIAVGSLVFLILRKRRFFTDLALPMAEALTPKIFIILVLTTQGIQCVYGFATNLIDSLLPAGVSLEGNYADAMAGLLTPIGLTYVLLIGPIFEELIFRGAIMGSLRRYGDNFAILFSAIFFGFYHIMIVQIPFGFLMGLLLGYVAVRWSMRASIALHIVVNFLSVLLSFFSSPTQQNVGGAIMAACAVIIVVLAILWRKQLRARVNAGAAYYAHTYANGFSSIAFWVFIGILTAVGVFQHMGIDKLLQDLQLTQFIQ